jgi:hypothetical protein
MRVVYPDGYDIDREVYVYSIMGQEMLRYRFENQQISNSLNIQNLTSGLYFLKAGNTVRKFIR